MRASGRKGIDWGWGYHEIPFVITIASPMYHFKKNLYHKVKLLVPLPTVTPLTQRHSHFGYGGKDLSLPCSDMSSLHTNRPLAYISVTTKELPVTSSK